MTATSKQSLSVETLAEHLRDRAKGLMLKRQQEADNAAAKGERVRLGQASAEAERHREAMSQLQLVVDYEDRMLREMIATATHIPNVQYVNTIYQLAALLVEHAAVIRALATRPVSTWRHVKRGTTYTVIGEAELQAPELLRGGEKLTVYRCTTDGKLWARPTDEFNDGRFVTVREGE